MTRLALTALCVLGLSGLAVAQDGPPNGPPSNGLDCGHVSGGFSVDSVDVDLGTIAATLTGDVEGSLAGTIVESNSSSFAFGTISMTEFTGTVTTATGTLEVTGRLFQLSFGAPPDPDATTPTGGLSMLKLVINGGTGDTADAVGIIAGVNVSIGGPDGPPGMGPGYNGVVCTPAPEPEPTP